MSACGDERGRTVSHQPHYSNCLLFAIQQGVKVHVKWIGWCPHFYTDTHEFVYGKYGRNALYPLWFKGYGVVK